ncbi:MAG TPA: Re/Si-specific NAD(P)(+) transhydrogenase subunit alpha [Candidatus Polarisedimenticolaceae bacterium]|nr:Re/Si-specific NAD(P)(+) transhydrogenase subunit alpha [Candidatus Polarisedimenticolaceae bacterium]
MPDAVETAAKPAPTSTAPTPRLKIGVPKERHPGERRVACVPRAAVRLIKLGFDVLVETGAGVESAFTDQAYEEVGATVVPDASTVWAKADLILKVRAPEPDEIERLREGVGLISFIWPAQNKDLVAQLARRKATVLAMDAVPRISRAQKLDALSAMANVAGYRAVIEASSYYGRFLGGQITAAGRIRPATVLIVGAGVAGLAAVGTAKSLGAIVKAFDTREAVREQVESLGAQFITFQMSEKGEGEGGYAKQMSDAFLAAEQEFLAGHAKDADIVITTALIPGKPAPQLITSGAVVAMKTGSVIVDLAAEQGGNCALTERDRVVERYGVTIIGATDLASRLSRQASELYANNIVNLLEDMTHEGRFEIDLHDEVQRGMIVLKSGELLWPPPKQEVRAAAPQPKAATPAATAHAPAAAKPSSPWAGRILALVAAVLLALLGLYAPGDLIPHLTVFLLACVVGWHVVWNVTPALHTPLMSVTNAISGIIVIGGMLLTAGPTVGTGSLLAAVAVLVASINIAGGFLVTSRMLKMFRR